MLNPSFCFLLVTTIVPRQVFEYFLSHELLKNIELLYINFNVCRILLDFAPFLTFFRSILYCYDYWSLFCCFLLSAFLAFPCFYLAKLLRLLNMFSSNYFPQHWHSNLLVDVSIKKQPNYVNLQFGLAKRVRLVSDEESLQILCFRHS